MGNKNIETYVNILNELYTATGLIIEADTMLYEVNEPVGENKIVADIKWDNEKKEYYPKYRH